MSDETLLPVPKTWTIGLHEPVVHNGGTFGELKLREPTMGELHKALGELKADPSQQGNARMQSSLVSIVSGLERAVVERMPFSVIVAASEWLLDFTVKPPATAPS